MGKGPGAMLRRLGERLTKSTDELHADKVREQTRSRGTIAIDTLADRQIATVSGTIRSVSLQPQSSALALVAELFDGSTLLVLIWLGRRRIRGIEPGVNIQVTGRVCHREGRPTIFNPAYDLLPRPS
ncbi:MAG: OB-fold nucleic acid binding domain-containing protein [Tetrasphaera sp.]